MKLGNFTGKKTFKISTSNLQPTTITRSVRVKVECKEVRT